MHHLVQLMKDPAARERLSGYGAMVAAIVLFSTIEVSSKMANAQAAPLLLAFVRFFLTGAVLLAPALKLIRLRAQPLGWHDGVTLLLLGVFGVTLTISLYHMAIPELRANVAAIVFSANPAFVVLFAPWLLGEQINWRKLAAVVLGLAGIVVFALNRGLVDCSLKGILLMTGALVAFALYTVLSKKFMPRFGAVVITCSASLIGSLLIFPLSLLLEGNPWMGLAAFNWPVVLYLTLVATALAYVLFFYGIINIGAARGSLFFFLKPVLAAAFAWALLGEPVNRLVVGGAGLILASLVFALVPTPRRLIWPE